MKTLAWLAFGFAAMCFANGLTATPEAAWLANLALLVFLDRNQSRASLFCAVAAVVGGFQVQFIGLLPEPLMSAGFALVYGLIYASPFFFYRWVPQGNLSGSAKAFLFALAWVTAELVAKTALPYGSWFSLAHVLPADSGWAQWAALGGTALTSFFFAWSAALVAAIFADAGQGRAPSKNILLCLGIVGVVVCGGSIRARRDLIPSSTVRIALIAPNPKLHEAFLSAAQMPTREPTPAEAEALRTAAAALNASLERDTKQAITAGAKMVVWSEGAAMILEADQRRYLATLSQIAATRGIYLFASFIAWTPGAEKIIRNRVAAIEPSGRIAWIFEKARPIYGFETETTPFGNLQPAYLHTPWGLVGLAVCHDVDFPDFVAEAGRRQVDIFLAPSNDWEAIDEFHARMAQLRAVENGFTLIRPTKGLGFVAGPTGRLRAWSNSFQDRTTLQVVDVPVVRLQTWYPVLGESVSYLSLVGLLLLIAFARFRHLSNGRPELTTSRRSKMLRCRRDNLSASPIPELLV